jgi:cell wall-associated NlpC family hydrolase
MTSETGARLEEGIAEIVRAASSQPLPGVQLSVVQRDDRVAVTGTVVTAGQAQAVSRLADAHGADVEVAVLADPAQGLEQGWLAITGEGLSGGVLEVWREPALMGRDHARQTEYLAADGPLRLLGRSGAAQLVQGPDLTLGWIGEAGVAETGSDAARLRWDGVRRSEQGSAVLPDPSMLTFGGGAMDALAAVIGASRAHLGVPYRWGGTTAAGFDCSGFLQRVFASETGVLLPKHTGDQRRAGIRVSASSARAGDLLFAAPKSRRVGHVMLVTSPDTVIHACQTESRVIEEPLQVNAERYQHQGYRRPVLLLP